MYLNIFQTLLNLAYLRLIVDPQKYYLCNFFVRPYSLARFVRGYRRETWICSCQERNYRLLATAQYHVLVPCLSGFQDESQDMRHPKYYIFVIPQQRHLLISCRIRYLEQLSLVDKAYVLLLIYFLSRYQTILF